MNVEEALQQMREMHYENPIDVTDRVMEQVSRTPLLVPSAPTVKRRIFRYVGAVAASVLVLLAVNFAWVNFRHYDDNQINTLFAEVYDYNLGFDPSSSATCNEMDVATFLLDE